VYQYNARAKGIKLGRRPVVSDRAKVLDLRQGGTVFG
jgi:hypothetical protein